MTQQITYENPTVDDVEEFDEELEDMERQLNETPPSRAEQSSGPLSKLSQRWRDYKNNRSLESKAKEMIRKDYAGKIREARKDAKIEATRAKYEEKLRVAKMPVKDKMAHAMSKLQGLANTLAPAKGDKSDKFTKFFGGRTGDGASGVQKAIGGHTANNFGRYLGGRTGDGASGVQKAIGGGLNFNKNKLNALIGKPRKKGSPKSWL